MDEQSPPTALNILVVDDEVNIRKTLSIHLEASGHHVVAVSNTADARTENSQRSFDLAFVDLRLGTAHGMDLIPVLLADSPWLRVVIITAYGTIESVVEAMKRGAFDYLSKPFTPAQVSLITQRVSELRQLEDQAGGKDAARNASESFVSMESSSPAMQRAVRLARQVAETDVTVLMRGESGTGKGVLGEAIHRWSKRAAKSFATVSCPSLSPQLLESELFGHVRGAFTGAIRDNPGRIASCDGGTLFLDEIGDLPLELQPKLLRFVQNKEYERVGDSQLKHADVRIISATNVDLEAAVRNGTFREDLFYRINVVQIDLPPLRERADDIVPLAENILRVLGASRRILGFTDEAKAALRNHPWPGNVRELRNTIEHAVVFCQSDRIGVEHLPTTLTSKPSSVRLGDHVPLDQIEETHIRRVLATSKSLEEAANTLGIDLATLWRRRRKYGI